ncbi:MAG: EcsC family protein [Methylococcales bacterium]|nr:EcsC family protein [Methylococcales bacterium]
MQKADLAALANAVQQLESSNLATSLSHMIGMPIEKAMAALPGHWSNIVSRMTRIALEKALDTALYSLNEKPLKPKNKIHTLLVGVSGAVGGTFGITALAIELPFSATIMLRSIADIARNFGEDLNELESKMACLTVFALSGGKTTTPSKSSEAADTSYYAVRSFLTKALGDTTNHIAVHGLSKESAPVMIKFVNAVSARFSVPVSEKIAAQSLPIVGAVSGASVNYLFIKHYQKMAKAHFLIRSLERKYGSKIVKKKYKNIIKYNHKQKSNKWNSLEHNNTTA